MSWTAAMVTFYAAAMVPVVWHRAQLLAFELVHAAGHPVVTVSAPIALIPNAIRPTGEPTP